MKRACLMNALVLALVAGSLVGTAVSADSSQASLMGRWSRSDVKQALIGALAFLEDTQIRNRPGKGHLSHDASDEGDGCRNQMYLSLPFKESLPVPLPRLMPMRNQAGEWASHVHFLPRKMGIHGRNVFSVQDSNMFMTAFIGFPLFLFDDGGLPRERQFIRNMLPLARSNIDRFKRHDAYNFWLVRPGVYSAAPCVSPLNIPSKLGQTLAKAYNNPKNAGFWERFLKGSANMLPHYWSERVMDAAENPSGADALFNIPNDADDTSTAVAFQGLCARYFPEKRQSVDVAALARVGSFRDLDRDCEDGRDRWKGKNTGAYLTWLKDERQPVFAEPETGVIPLAKNNVDAVVNANVVNALALLDMKSTPGYRDSLRVLARAINARAWPQAGLYYPQYMIFPYTVSRAFRDGGATEEPLAGAMPKLLADVLADQVAWEKAHPDQAGAFPGGEDADAHLSTALGLSTLLNIGRGTAVRAGIAARYDRAVEGAVAYLLRVARPHKLAHATTRAVFPRSGFKGTTWKSGLFFSASYWDLAHWRSEAFTVAMVTEALAKYLVGFERCSGGFPLKSLRLTVAPTTSSGFDLIPTAGAR